MARILVIDADERTRVRACRQLRSQLHWVEEAADGDAGIAQHRAHPYDLILLDILAPLSEGFHTVQALYREFPKARVIVSSEWWSSAAPMEDIARAYGAVGALPKPWDARHLLETVRAAA